MPQKRPRQKKAESEGEGGSGVADGGGSDAGGEAGSSAAGGAAHAALTARVLAALAPLGRRQPADLVAAITALVLAARRILVRDAFPREPTRAVAIVASTIGLTEHRACTCLSQRARILFDLSELEASRDEFARCAILAEAALGPNDREIATALGGVACALTELRRYAEAVPLLHRCIGIVTALEGVASGSAELIKLRSNLALTLGTLGRWADASPLFHNVMVVTAATDGTGSVSYALRAANYVAAALNCDADEPAALANLLEEALATRAPPTARTTSCTSAPASRPTSSPGTCSARPTSRASSWC